MTLRRHRRKWRQYLLIGGLAALIFITYGVVVVVGYLHRPLGPVLVTPEAAGAPAPAVPVAGPEPACGGPAVMYLLVVGSDTRSGGYTSGHADVIRLARIDFVAPSATVLAIPRDLWVVIPGLAQHGIVENRIKTAYSYGNVYAVPGGGPSLLAQTLAQNFDLPADHYVVVDFAAFEAGIDAIGGVEVAVPVSLGAPGSADYFPAGLQHMDGRTARAYAQVRGDASDLYRIERQTQVILAIREKVLSPQVLPSLPGLVDAMRDAVLTDLSPAELSRLVCIFQKIEDDAITMTEIDSSMLTPDSLLGQEVMLPDYGAIAQLARTFQAGGLP